MNTNTVNIIIAVVGIALIGIGAILTMYAGDETRPDGKQRSPGGILSIVAGIAVFIFAFSFVIIPTGYTGVKATFGQIDENPVPNGINFKIPFVQSIAKVNNKLQDISFNDGIVEAEASDRTKVYYTDVTVTYRINSEKSAWIYANVSNYSNDLIDSTMVGSALKAMSKTLAVEDATNRAYIETDAATALQEDLDEKYGENVVIVSKVVIGNAYYDASYDEAIANKQEATLAAETQAIENQKNVDMAEADAKVLLTETQAEADALLIEAQAQADANALLNESLTEKILQQEYIEKWDGALPRVTLGDGADMIFDISEYADDIQTIE